MTAPLEPPAVMGFVAPDTGRAAPHTDNGADVRASGRVAARAGIIGNPRSRHNRSRHLIDEVNGDVSVRVPLTQSALLSALRDFAKDGVEILVIDGGDGTVRDVLSAAPHAFGDSVPPIAVLPSGKTNALALDLGIPPGWTIEQARAALAASRFKARAPIEIRRPGETPLRGFILGFGNFVRATDLAQRTHAMGAFGGLAIGLSILGAFAQTLFGRAGNPWRSGERVDITSPGTQGRWVKELYLLLGSTLHRMPLGVRPFGDRPSGLNMLAIEAPPRLLTAAAPALLLGKATGWLAGAGYHRASDVPPLDLMTTGDFILDGETFAGGMLSIRAGDPVRFVVP